MYEVPGTKGIEKCVVDAGAIDGTSPVLLVTGDGSHVTFTTEESKPEQKSA